MKNNYKVYAKDLTTGWKSNVETDDFDQAIGIFERAKQLARCRGLSVELSITGIFGELIETTTVNPLQEVAAR